MKNLLIITVLFIMGFVSSCKKDETTTPAKTKKELLTAKIWIASEATAFGQPAYKRGNKPADQIVDLDKVSLKFNTDGTITGIDNNGKTLSGAKWVLSTDETKLTISNSGVIGLDGDLPIVQLQESILEVKGKVVIPQLGSTPIEANVKMIPQ
jgi:hypothetical protein